MEYNVNRYRDLLIEENTRQNLVSRKSIDSELDMHIQDSLVIKNYLNINRQKLIDIGSGAGFPGLILAIHYPEASFTLVESDKKKSTFLSRVVQEIGLKNTVVINHRVEELGQDGNFRERFDICTARAVAPMQVLLEYGIPLLKTGGCLALWKGKNYAAEIETARTALTVLQSEVEEVFHYNLIGERDRAIVLIRKNQSTPAIYPRRVGIPAKRPL
ncbi:MAG: 16S rRNA (guanine(527)-N(7))-methyltransferase RsmG [Syntrophomonadaceae bacterium]|jgi:16S rRNA (guanine527-N7)-methyltransferase